MLYFDFHATAPLDPSVREYMLKSLDCNQANPHSSEHLSGLLSAREMHQDIELIAENLGCDSDEIIITSGATEANNLAFHSMLHDYSGSRKRILTTIIEHKSVLDPLMKIYAKQFKIEFIPIDSQGNIDMDAYKSMMSDDVVLVSCMLVNNEIGNVYPIKLMSEIAHSYGALFHTDASQGIYEDIDLDDIDVDMMSISSHKMYGPKGIGALYLQRDLHNTMKPMLYGGGQQSGMRPGTMAPFLIAGFSKALDVLVQSRDSEADRLSRLRAYFLQELHNHGIQYTINGSINLRHPGNLNLSFGFCARDFLNHHQEKICASTGSACNGFAESHSYVLQALKLPKKTLEGSVRLSIGRYTTIKEIDEVINLIHLYNERGQE